VQVHGTQGSEPGDPVNPIWVLVNDSMLESYPTNYAAVSFYNDSGAIVLDDFEGLVEEMRRLGRAFDRTSHDAGRILSANQPDRSLRTGLRANGWDPQGDPLKLALEWYEVDYELAQTAVCSNCRC
jgi:polyamine oxidase